MQFTIPFVYVKPEHIKCFWQKKSGGDFPHNEIHWLTFGTDYAVTNIQEQDTGGTLTLIKALPSEAQQLVIRRVTPRTQTIDLYNGARLTAELIESMVNKTTMLIQELDAQVVNRDALQKIIQDINDVLENIVGYPGPPGADGLTPFISGEDWYLGSENIGPARGQTGSTGPRGSTGPPGADGLTPFISGEDWFLGSENIGPARGSQGHTPYITDDYWYIDGSVIGPARGPTGATGADGITPHISGEDWYLGYENIGPARGPKGDTGPSGGPTGDIGPTGPTGTEGLNVLYTNDALSIIEGGDKAGIKPNVPTGRTAKKGDIVISAKNGYIGIIDVVTSQASVKVITVGNINGITPVYIDGDWFLNGTFAGPAIGPKGDTGSTPKLSGDYWWIGGSLVGPARGPTGATGADGLTPHISGEDWFLGSVSIGPARGPTVVRLPALGPQGTEIATEQFISHLRANGLLPATKSFGIGIFEWMYSTHGYIKSTTGTPIPLAGARVEVINDANSQYIIRITTAPTSSGVPSVQGVLHAGTKATFEYRNHGSQYSPTWVRLLNDIDPVLMKYNGEWWLNGSAVEIGGGSDLNNVSGWPVSGNPGGFYVPAVGPVVGSPSSGVYVLGWNHLLNLLGQYFVWRDVIYVNGAKLSSADFSSANLSSADFSGADLSDANLSGTDLRGANLSSTDLNGTDLHRIP